ncbi:hypothetical protein CLU79DRAFT_838662 [Phycomyces nitens]|nr:hypothetical protein CLU79DRAFT_838662 [Phycomyces nitens]
MAIHHFIPNFFVLCSHIQAINTYHHITFLRVGSYGCTQTNIAAIWYRLLSYSVSMVAGRFDLRKQDKLGGDIFPHGIQGSKGRRGPEQSSSVRPFHRCRLLSYSVSMVASRFDLRKQDELGGDIFPPGIQGSKGSRGPEQSSSVRPLL